MMQRRLGIGGERRRRRWNREFSAPLSFFSSDYFPSPILAVAYTPVPIIPLIASTRNSMLIPVPAISTSPLSPPSPSNLHSPHPHPHAPCAATTAPPNRPCPRPYRRGTPCPRPQCSRLRSRRPACGRRRWGSSLGIRRVGRDRARGLGGRNPGSGIRMPA